MESRCERSSDWCGEEKPDSRKGDSPKTPTGRSREEKGTPKEKQVPARRETPRLWTQQPDTSQERRG
ncbi:hypothetical protein NDU88_007172 [Pleurodeles waltl]|uniref:Uncharacterized protein n=1 Tax=Pleurodeles waltl TaxID=8319 RepID=A0AAV7UR60_PLEWA|nr:hypothetical protein NDU88_007172 [Pleurodeles waltl]